MQTPPDRATARSFLLRLSDQPGHPCLLVQDLRTGERHVFDRAAALHRFLARLLTRRRHRPGPAGASSCSNP